MLMLTCHLVTVTATTYTILFSNALLSDSITSICCRFVVQFVVAASCATIFKSYSKSHNLLNNKSTTNRTNGVRHITDSAQCTHDDIPILHYADLLCISCTAFCTA